MIRHRVANLCLIDHNFKNPNFLIFNRNLLKLSLTCFSHFSTPIKTNLISGWTSPLSNIIKSSLKASERALTNIALICFKLGARSMMRGKWDTYYKG